ncbi:hypothetical protein CPT_Seuss35 [Caulobacter phage Seuss]|uniref:Uncharacterized protein n=1 Tax=Caulobacter phage Seuss TaxID=1675601 RepID=A0A0K1LM30_9CAUD|nr:hypothetical protein HOR08_gp035 [Caulobacter phage Seuss]AKU43561.1 hypothetical protein CPT_Seuss35 [Caulobacter phage Seuss]
MAGLLNRVKMGISGAPGNGATITLASAETGFQSFATAGAVVGMQYSYTIEEGQSLWESGFGTYNGSTFVRDQVVAGSSGAGVRITITNAAKIFVTALSEDIGAGNLATLMKYGAAL